MSWWWVWFWVLWYGPTAGSEDTLVLWHSFQTLAAFKPASPQWIALDYEIHTWNQLGRMKDHRMPSIVFRKELLVKLPQFKKEGRNLRPTFEVQQSNFSGIFWPSYSTPHMNSLGTIRWKGFNWMTKGIGRDFPHGDSSSIQWLIWMLPFKQAIKPYDTLQIACGFLQICPTLMIQG